MWDGLRDIGLLITNSPGTTGTFSAAIATIAVPVSPPLIGTTMTSQSVAFSLDNPLNLVTSNGLVWTIGN